MSDTKKIAAKVERNLYAMPAYDNDYFQQKDLATIAAGLADWTAELHTQIPERQTAFVCRHWLPYSVRRLRHTNTGWRFQWT